MYFLQTPVKFMLNNSFEFNLIFIPTQFTAAITLNYKEHFVKKLGRQPALITRISSNLQIQTCKFRIPKLWHQPALITRIPIDLLIDPYYTLYAKIRNICLAILVYRDCLFPPDFKLGRQPALIAIIPFYHIHPYKL